MNKSHKKTISEALGRHPVHPFPARMAPGIALDIVSKARPDIRILDPMMGSGTVLALARSNGHHSFGFDIDPLAVLITKVWTTPIECKKARVQALNVLTRARRVHKHMSLADAYPRNADRETRNFIRYWFDKSARRQLAALARVINRTHDKAVRDVLWCAFSRLIITKQAGASLAMDLAHSRPHKSFDVAPIKPFRKFVDAVDRVLENCIAVHAKSRGPKSRVKCGDARNLDVRSDSVDLVLTSPPYLNAIDYMRCSKFSLIWMGHTIAELRDVRSHSVGSEVGKNTDSDGIAERIFRKLKLDPQLSNRHRAILARFIHDMRQAIDEVARVLVPGGKAVYVIGENTISGTYIRNSDIICALAKSAGLRFKGRKTRNLPPNRRYLPPPSRKTKAMHLDTRMRREVIIAFRKPKHWSKRKVV